EMYDAVMKHAEDYDYAILSAAVADFTPTNQADGKLKKSEVGSTMQLDLQQTRDILSALGRRKREQQILIGFALESNNEIEFGKQKLIEKNCDMIVVNT